ncbi:hypothetical protein E2I00_004457, partial [Balaenoptera physalus]
PLDARNSLKWTMNANFVPFKRGVWPQKLLLMLWVKNGSVMWSKSLVGTTNKVSHESGCLHGRVHLLLRGSPVTDQGRLEKESANLFRVALWTPVQSLTLLHLVDSGPKSLKFANFSISLEKIMSTSVLKAAEYAKLLAKGMKEAKEKCQEETTKRGRLSSLKDSTSESSQK